MRALNALNAFTPFRAMRRLQASARQRCQTRLAALAGSRAHDERGTSHTQRRIDDCQWTGDSRVSAQPRSGAGGHGRVVLVQTADSNELALRSIQKENHGRLRK